MTSSEAAEAHERGATLSAHVGLAGLAVVATTADAATTWLAMQLAAVRDTLAFVELNPAMRHLITSVGPLAALVVRVVAGVALVAFLTWAARRSSWGWRPLAVATILLYLVVAWNLTALALILP